MSQVEIYEFLSNNPKKWYSSKQLIRFLNKSKSSKLITCLKKLRKFDMVYRKIGTSIDDKGNKFRCYYFKYKPKNYDIIKYDSKDDKLIKKK